MYIFGFALGYFVTTHFLSWVPFPEGDTLSVVFFLLMTGIIAVLIWELWKRSYLLYKVTRDMPLSPVEAARVAQILHRQTDPYQPGFFIGTFQGFLLTMWFHVVLFFTYQLGGISLFISGAVAIFVVHLTNKVFRRSYYRRHKLLVTD